MQLSSIAVSAPGSLMLLGEHAVLHGRWSLVASVHQRLTVTLTPRADRTLAIESALGTHITALDAPESHPKFRFLLAAVAAHAPRLLGGLTLHVMSEFSDQIGFGSSAAVTAAAVAALRAYSDEPHSAADVFPVARDLIRAVQGRGSGADVAASCHGGLVAYRVDPPALIPLAAPGLRLAAVYSGSKLPTPEVIRIVDERRAADPARYEALFDHAGRCAERAIEVVRHGDTAALGALLDEGQAVMEEMGLCNDALAAIVRDLRADPGIRGAKISGSGLGDCAIGLGTPSPAFQHAFIPVTPSADGLRVEATPPAA